MEKPVNRKVVLNEKHKEETKDGLKRLALFKRKNSEVGEVMTMTKEEFENLEVGAEYWIRLEKA